MLVRHGHRADQRGKRKKNDSLRLESPMFGGLYAIIASEVSKRSC